MGNHHEMHEGGRKAANTTGYNKHIGPICHLPARARNPGQTPAKVKRTLGKQIWPDTKPSQEQIFHIVLNS